MGAARPLPLNVRGSSCKSSSQACVGRQQSPPFVSPARAAFHQLDDQGRAALGYNPALSAGDVDTPLLSAIAYPCRSIGRDTDADSTLGYKSLQIQSEISRRARRSDQRNSQTMQPLAVRDWIAKIAKGQFRAHEILGSRPLPPSTLKIAPLFEAWYHNVLHYSPCMHWCLHIFCEAMFLYPLPRNIDVKDVAITNRLNVNVLGERDRVRGQARATRRRHECPGAGQLPAASPLSLTLSPTKRGGERT